MNKRYLSCSMLLMLAVMANAQGMVDALRFNKSDYQGTARSQAMGSAFGALGADLTSQVINPAGIATYRATELGLTFGVAYNGADSKYYGFTYEDDKISVPFNQIGFSFCFMTDNPTGIKSHSFSMSYSRTGDYNRNAVYVDNDGYNSMLDYFCSDRALRDEFTGGLASDAGWINKGENYSYNMWETADLDPSARRDEVGGLINHTQYVKEKGDKGEACFTYGMNISDFLYWGASMGISNFHYNEEMSHFEENMYNGGPQSGAFADFTYCTKLRQYGTGVNFKVGAILRPLNVLRVGFALHSATFYNVDEEFSAAINGATKNVDYTTGRYRYEYNYRVPCKFVASAAGVIGKYAIVSFDFEHSNYGNGKFKDVDGGANSVYDGSTQNVKDNLKGTNTIRIGAEARPIDKLYLRAGFSKQSSPFKSGVMVNDFMNRSVSGGIGYRANNFFIDFAYVNRKTCEDRWVLYDSDVYEYDPDGNQPASITSTVSNYILTVGFKF